MLSSYRSVSRPLGAMAEGYPSTAEVEPRGRSVHAADDARHPGGPPPGTGRLGMHGGERFGRAERRRRRARLDALGGGWMTTPATIIYRTTQRKPGEATSPHQCLRQMVGDAVGGRSGIQSGLRICSGMGVLRLAWDPPDRWRIDQAASGNRLTLLSTHGGSVRCHVARQ